MTTKSAKVELRVPPEEKAEWDALAKESGLTLSKWIRWRLREPGTMVMQTHGQVEVPIGVIEFNADGAAVCTCEGYWRLKSLKTQGHQKGCPAK